ncbi:MAG: MMPL family transporter, partial [Candidatus Thermoplasmatota archaeon]|nr:MMPL family transporter [Candidatus Thermoplasmatota archaeon]
MEVLADFVERRAVPILIVILIISIFFFSMVPRISFKTDIRGFLPDNEMSQANARVMDYYGDAPSIHFILVKAINKEEDVLTPLSLKEQYKLVKSLKELDGVEETLSIADVVNILYQYRLDKSGSMTINRSRNISDAENASYEEIRTKLNLMFGILNGSYGEEIVSMFSDNFPMFSDNSLDNVKLLINLLFSKDFDLDDAHAKATIIIVNLDGGLSNDELKELARSIHERTDELQAELVTIELSHTGEYQIATEIDQATRDTMGVIVGAIFIVIAIMLYIGFRRGSYVILPLGILLLATVWTFGTAYIIGLKFSAVMVGVIPLIFGLGVDYPVHVSERYQEELGKGKKISIALKTAIKHVGGAIAICAISTAIGFFSNIISDVEPVRVFGITCAIGTSYAFILTLFFYCPARFLLDKRAKHNPLLPHKMKQLALEAKSRVKKKKHTLFTKTSYKFPGSIAIMALVITALAVLGTFNLESEFSMKDFLPDDWESLKTEEKIFEMFEAGSYTQSFILVESNSVATTEVYNDIRETILRISDDSNIVSISSKDGDRLSLTEGIPRLVEMAH